LKVVIRRFQKNEIKGKHVGSYKIIRELGYGGMGAVYLAERTDRRYEQQVALKMMRAKFALPGQTNRFLAEWQILATLDHENIARLLDGGLAGDNPPYQVMELVEGEPIDSYCDKLQLPIRQRLELFLTVCNAVQYAHGKSIVHCDIKPSNILVKRDGKVKLLDFGIAKMVGEQATSSSSAPIVKSHCEPPPLTPLYASPEQVRRDTVSTASDIYQLGIVLYELLSGRHPYEVTGRTPAETQDVICSEQPPRPSTACCRRVTISTETSAAPSRIARLRQTTPKHLRRQLSGQLDTIVLKALAKNPEHRHQTIAQFSRERKRSLPDNHGRI